MLNAFRHADASRIDVVLDYAAQAFRLSVRDDGKGFDPHMAVAFERSSHFGLRGMRERARRVGGRIDIEAAGRGGVTIGLVVPARFAYASLGWRWLQWLRGTFGGKSA